MRSRDLHHPVAAERLDRGVGISVVDLELPQLRAQFGERVADLELDGSAQWQQRPQGPLKIIAANVRADELTGVPCISFDRLRDPAVHRITSLGEDECYHVQIPVPRRGRESSDAGQRRLHVEDALVELVPTVELDACDQRVRALADGRRHVRQLDVADDVAGAGQQPFDIPEAREL
jgi:hypothetical protein